MRSKYPGFFAALFLVLLRIAIGWHLLYEGMQKIMSTDEGKQYLGAYFHPTKGPTFTSEGYQRNATGPLAHEFRNLIPDVDSRDALNLEKLKTSWQDQMHRIANHFAFGKEQQEAAGKELVAREQVAQAWFEDPENREKIKKYLDNLDSLAALDAKPNKMSYEVERFYEARKLLDGDRRTLIAPIDTWAKSLNDGWIALATKEQRDQYGEFKAPMSEVQRADRITMYGLTICGLCLILGLLSPIAALGAAGFLTLFYISLPPWPGLPEPPNVEGHYLYVNKNLIELIACLALAFTPTSLWLGLDAILFGWITRIRQRRAMAKLVHEVAAELNAEPSERVVVSHPKKTR